MSAGGGYQVSADEMRRVISGLVEVTAQIQHTIGQLGGLSVPGGCFGGVGSAVATANTAVQAQSTATLGAVLSTLQELNRRLTTSADGYDRADRTVADVLAVLGTSDRLIQRMR